MSDNKPTNGTNPSTPEQSSKQGLSDQTKQAFPPMPKDIAAVILEGPIASAPGAIEYFMSNMLLETAFMGHLQVRGSTGQVIQKEFDAVAIYINSPGGSPAQSEMIGKRIRQLANKTGKPVYAFVGDSAASGGYWIACAADEIYLCETSVAGSIGVVREYNNHHKKMEKAGIKRITLTSGKNKRKNNPYSEHDPKHDKHALKQLEYLHKKFIAWVMECRGDKIKKQNKDFNEKDLMDNEVFTAETYFGQQAVDKGLADGIGHMNETLEKIFGDNARIHPLMPPPPQQQQPANNNYKNIKLPKKDIL